MNTVLFAALLLSLPVTPMLPEPPAALQEKMPQQKSAQRGRWYMADSGHAVYCIGPVVTVPDHDGNLMRVATFCRGPEPVVALHE